MKTSNRIIALVMAVLMVVCMSAFCVSADGETVAVDLVQARAGAITLDGAKDFAYNKGAKISFSETDTVAAEGWLTWDADYLYFFVDITDATTEKEPSDEWGKDCVDYFVDFGCDGDPVQYRIARDGVLSDDVAPIDCEFRGYGVEKEDNSGWTAEFAVPVPAGAKKVGIAAFAQDWDEGEWGTQAWLQDHAGKNADVWTASTYPAFNLVKAAPKVADGAITLDGIKDYEYKDAAIINHEKQDTITAIGYMVWDTDYVYYLAEIYDDSLNTELNDETQPWNSENYEIGLGSASYRVSRNGTISDQTGKVGDAIVDYPFEAKVSEMGNGNGWIAEFKIPLADDATTFDIGWGFAQDWDVYGVDWSSTGLAMVLDTGSIILADEGVALYENAGEITLDAVKDDAYADATVINYKNTDAISATGYLTWKGDTIYYFAEVLDATNALEAGSYAWECENVELSDGKVTYRVSRDGVISDIQGNTGDAVAVPFEAKVAEMADGKGWTAEFAIPVTGSTFATAGFCQDWDLCGDYDGDGSQNWDAEGLAYMDGSIDVTLASAKAENNVFFEGAAPITLKLGDMKLFTEPYIPSRSTEGITVWFRVNGLKAPHVFTNPKSQIVVQHFDPIYQMEDVLGEDGQPVVDETTGETKQQKVLGEDCNPLVVKDKNGNTVFSQEATELICDTNNHGQDGMRSASWTITADGDYLVYMPFKHYSLNHQFTGIDYITAVNYYSLCSLNVAKENKEATITPMGIFENKVESFETTLNADGVEQVIEGNYTYKNAELEGDGWTYDDIPGKVGNLDTHELYVPEDGYTKNLVLFDENGEPVLNEDGTYVRDARVDSRPTIKKTWQIAYVNEVLPEKVGEVENPVWFDAAKGGNPMIPHGQNTLYASAKVSVTFRDDAGNDIEIVTVAPGSAAAPTATPTKEAGNNVTYTFAGWVDKDGNAVDLSAVTENIVVYASFTAELSYTDVADEWFREAVEYVTMNGLMNGVSGTQFGPTATTTRGMVVTVLYRMEGEPSVEGMEAHPFTDLTQDWYANAITWAYNTKIVNGMTPTTFAPDAAISREQFATIMYRYADEIKGYYVEAGKASLADLYDRDAVSDWAQKAVKWAIADADDMNTTGFKAYDKTPLLGGKAITDGKPVLDPKGNATRAEMATMLMRFLEGEHIAK